MNQLDTHFPLSSPLDHYTLHRINVPCGRVIGDNMCHYSAFTVCVVCLFDRDGRVGYGYGERVTDGKFTKPAPWYAPMPALPVITDRFQNEVWPHLIRQSTFTLRNTLPDDLTIENYLHAATRKALRDLIAKQCRRPLYQLLGGAPQNNRVSAYGSPLAFHLSEQEVVKLFQRCILEQGMKAVKVKVGHPDPQWDVRRLELVRETVGPGVEINIDANTAWTARQTIERHERFQRSGIRLGYIEDPLPPDDVEGYALLGRELPVDVAGHDYVVDSTQLRKLLDVGGLQRLRARDDLDDVAVVAELSREYAVPVLTCNSFAEENIHAAAAFSFDRIEFADLGWNRLIRDPVRISNGCMFAPIAAGSGLDPVLELLEEWAS